MSNYNLVPNSETEFYKTIDQFLQPLEKFSTLQNCLFSAACCERFVKFYQAFQERENWGDYSKIRNLLDLCWSSIENFNQIKKDELSRALVDMEDYLPDEEEFGTDAVLLAGMVWATIYTLVNHCLGKIEHADAVPQQIFETLLTVITTGNPPDEESAGKVIIGYPPELRELEISFFNDLRVKQEMKYQKEDMDNIISRGEVDNNLITLIRERSKTNQWDADKFLEELENR